ncbi:unnamed protein product [Allacma fusca]|uniref:Uncharacterized protein n=1 Tax=Allacma fusca TaxID=39272 RepID=A0A8J2PER6_9HEXA|nr:unnamed protein product [Allacma fusca]
MPRIFRGHKEGKSYLEEEEEFSNLLNDVTVPVDDGEKRMYADINRYGFRTPGIPEVISIIYRRCWLEHLGRLKFPGKPVVSL